MDDWLKFREEAQRRDHRNVGRQQDLFFFNDISPGSAFFMPHGTRIYNSLVQFIRGHYWRRGFHEVITPNMYNVKLWERSGHWQNYQENMFSFPIENETFAMKPMNCPGHCVMFGTRPRYGSWEKLREGESKGKGKGKGWMIVCMCVVMYGHEYMVCCVYGHVWMGCIWSCMYVWSWMDGCVWSCMVMNGHEWMYACMVMYV